MNGIKELIFLELLNGIWTTLDACLLGWFTYYIVAMYRELDYFDWHEAFKRWWAEGFPPHIAAAIAIYVFTLGDVIVRAYIWLWRHYANAGHAFKIEVTPLLIGGIICAVGLLCKIRVFTVYRLGNKAWLFSATLAAVFALVGWLSNRTF